jgi:biopolymer transport protein TolR
MGMSLGGGGRRGHSRRFRPVSEINVTPMVDVMLVLLVIFMVTAPLLTAGVPLELPKTKAQPLKGNDKPLAVSIKADGSVWLQETRVQVDELAPRLMAITANKPDTRIFVRSDKTVDYGRFAEVMGALQVGGFTKVGLVTESQGSTPERKAGR